MPMTSGGKSCIMVAAGYCPCGWIREFGSWKTGEGIAIVGGGASLTMILAAAAAVITAAAGVGAAV
ncbi:MAG: hypothetical protein WB697_08995, partial [Stellaceae bacterium]